ncbi:MAG: cysteine desulfurase/selenocysteine lyase [Paraglaciecola sp.]
MSRCTIRLSLAAYNNGTDIITFGVALIECISLLTESDPQIVNVDSLLELKQNILIPIAESIKQAKT